MHHWLGTIPLEPHLPLQILLAFQLRRSERNASLPWGMRAEPPRAVSDLLEASPGDRPWLEPVHGALVALKREGRRPRLTHCERDRTVTLAVHDASHKKAVRPGDFIFSGFAARRDEGGDLQILPRVFRSLCSNGAVVYSHDAEDVLQECVGGVADAVRACFAEETFQGRTERLRRAAAQPVGDPMEILGSLALPIREQDVLDAREEHDPTVYGLLNALTALARREATFARRLELERKAEDLLQHARLIASQLSRPREQLLTV